MRAEKQADTNYAEFVIQSVRRETSGWSVGTEAGHTWVIDKGIEPHVGDTLRLYSNSPRVGLGSHIRGIDINGCEVRYQTQEESEAALHRQLDEWEAKQRAEFEAGRETYLRRIAALPSELRTRMERLRKSKPDFDWRWGEYELFCCEQAVAIAARIKSRPEIQAFHEMPPEEQKALVPELSDEHSGWTFSCACRLAVALVTGEAA